MKVFTFQVVHEKIRFSCDDCDFVSKFKAQLKKHVLKKHEGNKEIKDL